MKTITTTWLAAITILGALPAQDIKLDSATLAKAVVLEETEHDLQKAIDLYRQLATSKRTHPSVATKAYLRLGQALSRVGKKTEAEAALAKAAAGKGPAAEAARRLQGRSGVQDEKVMQLIGEMLKLSQTVRGRPMSGPSYSKELVWIGRSAAPMLIRYVDGETVDMNFVTKAALTLYNIGGPDVERWLDGARTKYDVLKRRALVRVKFGEGVGGAVRAKVAQFVTDKDASVRVDTLNRHYSDIPIETIVEMLSDAAPEVREEAWGIIGSSRSKHKLGSGSVALMSKVLDAIESAEAYVPRRYLGTAYHGWGQRGPNKFASNESARRLWFRMLTMSEELGSPRGISLSSNLLPANAHAEDVRRVVMALGPVDLKTGPTRRQSSFAIALSSLIQTWNSEVTDVGMLLYKMGYLDVVSSGRDAHYEWLLRTASESDWVTILSSFDKHSKLVVARILRRAPKTAATFSALVPWANKRLQSASVSEHDLELLGEVCFTLASLGTSESTEWLAKFMAGGLSVPAVGGSSSKRLKLNDRLFWGMTLGRGEVAEATIARAIAWDLGDEPEAEEYRLACAWELIKRKSEFAPAAVSTYYRLAKPEGDSSHRRPTSLLLRLRGYPKPVGLTGSSFEASVMRAALSQGGERAWRDVAYLIRAVEKKTKERDVFQIDVVCELLDKAPPMVLRGITNLLGRFKGEFVVPTLRRLMHHSDGQVRAYAVSWARKVMTLDDELVRVLIEMTEDEDPGVVSRVLQVLRAKNVSSPEAIAAVRTVLTSHSYSLRVDAINLLTLVDVAGSGEVVMPMLRDSNDGVRRAACRFFGRSLDRKYAPALIEALKDREKAVSEAAQAALEAIRFYDQEKARWERILGTTGLGADPTEALVKQAQSKELRIRLVAIESLGTLGKAEVLPFLIMLMQDSDSKVAKAAENAVKRINSKPVKAELRK